MGISRLTVAALLAMLIVVQPAHSAILSATPAMLWAISIAQSFMVLPVEWLSG